MLSPEAKAKKSQQKVKCYRKQKLLRKAEELVRLCNIQVNLVMYDEEQNMLQEFKSCSYLNSEWIADHKR